MFIKPLTLVPQTSVKLEAFALCLEVRMHLGFLLFDRCHLSLEHIEVVESDFPNHVVFFHGLKGFPAAMFGWQQDARRTRRHIHELGFHDSHGISHQGMAIPQPDRHHDAKRKNYYRQDLLQKTSPAVGQRRWDRTCICHRSHLRFIIADEHVDTVHAR